MIFTPVEGHIIPEAVMARFCCIPPAEQLAHFRLYRHYKHTCSITDSGNQIRLPAFDPHRKGTPCDLLKHEFLTQDDIIVGIRIRNQDIYCYENPIGCLTHENGQRTSSDYWYYDEDHSWYSFFLADEHS